MQFAGTNLFRFSIARTPRRANPIAYRFGMFLKFFKFCGKQLHFPVVNGTLIAIMRDRMEE